MSTKLDFVTGDWVVRVEQLHLEHRHSGEVTPLEPRLAALLTSLVARKGDLVTKEMLLEEVWQGAVVSDDSIAQAISRLRKILGDDPKSPQYVQTVWKKGYRWLSQVEQTEDLQKPTPQHQQNWLWAIGGMFVVFFFYVFLQRDEVVVVGQYETRTITSLPGMESKAALSPDGNNVVFQYRPLGAGENTLLIQDINGGASKTLAEPGRHFTPVFSSDGNRVAYINHVEQGCEIVVKGLVSGKQMQALDCQGSVYPDLAWYEPSNRFALGLRAEAGLPVAIYSIESNGQKERLSQPPQGSWGDFDPAFSPDGNLVVFTRAYTEMQHDLILLDVENRQEQRLTHQRAAIMGASWTPSGKHVVFATRPRVGYRLYQLNIQTLAVTRLNVAANEVIEPHIAQNGDLVATARNFDTDLYQLDINSGESTTIFDSTHWDLSPMISPDSSTFVFTSDRNGLFQLWLGELNSGKTRPLTDFDGNYVVAPRFSPDSKRVVFEVHDGDHSQIYTIDLSSSLQLKLTEDPSLNVVPSVSSDGGAIYFGSNRSGTWQVWKKPLDGGDAVKVTKDGGYAAIESADGKWLYYNKRNEPGIWKLPVSGEKVSGESELVTDKLAADDVSAFAVSPNGIVYLDRSIGQYGAIVEQWQSGDIKEIYRLQSGIPRFDPVFSANFARGYLYLVKSNPISADLIKITGAFGP